MNFTRIKSVIGLAVMVMFLLSASSLYAGGYLIKGSKNFNPRYAFDNRSTCTTINGAKGANFVFDANGQKVAYPTKQTLTSPNVVGTDWTTYPEYTSRGYNFALNS